MKIKFIQRKDDNKILLGERESVLHDVDIICESTHLPCCKYVLASCSPYFLRLFSELQDNATGRYFFFVDAYGASLETWKSFLTYLSGEQIYATKLDVVKEMRRLATAFEMKSILEQLPRVEENEADDNAARDHDDDGMGGMESSEKEQKSRKRGRSRRSGKSPQKRIKQEPPSEDENSNDEDSKPSVARSSNHRTKKGSEKSKVVIALESSSLNGVQASTSREQTAVKKKGKSCRGIPEDVLKHIQLRRSPRLKDSSEMLQVLPSRRGSSALSSDDQKPLPSIKEEISEEPLKAEKEVAKSSDEETDIETVEPVPEQKHQEVTMEVDEAPDLAVVEKSTAETAVEESQPVASVAALEVKQKETKSDVVEDNLCIVIDDDGADVNKKPKDDDCEIVFEKEQILRVDPNQAPLADQSSSANQVQEVESVSQSFQNGLATSFAVMNSQPTDSQTLRSSQYCSSSPAQIVPSTPDMSSASLVSSSPLCYGLSVAHRNVTATANTTRSYTRPTVSTSMQQQPLRNDWLNGTLPPMSPPVVVQKVDLEKESQQNLLSTSSTLSSLQSCSSISKQLGRGRSSLLMLSSSERPPRNEYGSLQDSYKPKPPGTPYTAPTPAVSSQRHMKFDYSRERRNSGKKDSDQTHDKPLVHLVSGIGQMLLASDNQQASIDEKQQTGEKTLETTNQLKFDFFNYSNAGETDSVADQVEAELKTAIEKEKATPRKCSDQDEKNAATSLKTPSKSDGVEASSTSNQAAQDPTVNDFNSLMHDIFAPTVEVPTVNIVNDFLAAEKRKKSHKDSKRSEHSKRKIKEPDANKESTDKLIDDAASSVEAQRSDGKRDGDKIEHARVKNSVQFLDSDKKSKGESKEQAPSFDSKRSQTPKHAFSLHAPDRKSKDESKEQAPSVYPKKSQTPKQFLSHAPDKMSRDESKDRAPSVDSRRSQTPKQTFPSHAPEKKSRDESKERAPSDGQSSKHSEWRRIHSSSRPSSDARQSRMDSMNSPDQGPPEDAAKWGESKLGQTPRPPADMMMRRKRLVPKPHIPQARHHEDSTNSHLTNNPTVHTMKREQSDQSTRDHQHVELSVNQSNSSNFLGSASIPHVAESFIYPGTDLCIGPYATVGSVLDEMPMPGQQDDSYASENSSMIQYYGPDLTMYPNLTLIPKKKTMLHRITCRDRLTGQVNYMSRTLNVNSKGQTRSLEMSGTYIPPIDYQNSTQSVTIEEVTDGDESGQRALPAPSVESMMTPSEDKNRRRAVPAPFVERKMTPSGDKDRRRAVPAISDENRRRAINPAPPVERKMTPSADENERRSRRAPSVDNFHDSARHRAIPAPPVERQMAIPSADENERRARRAPSVDRRMTPSAERRHETPSGERRREKSRGRDIVDQESRFGTSRGSGDQDEPKGGERSTRNSKKSQMSNPK